MLILCDFFVSRTRSLVAQPPVLPTVLAKLGFAMVVGTALFFAQSAQAESYTSLSTPTGSSAAYAGLGVAVPGDFSSMDVNPALLPALERRSKVFGGLSGHDDPQLWEVGYLHQTTLPVSAAVRLRQTMEPATYSTNRQWMGAVGYKVPDTALSLGLGLAYEKYVLDGLTDSLDTNTYFTLGASYQLKPVSTEPILLGFAIRNIGDDYNPTLVNFGASSTLKPFHGYTYTVNTDLTFDDDDGLRTFLVGGKVSLMPELDIKGSFGFNNCRNR